MSEMDALAANEVDQDVVVFHQQLVEPIQLTLFTPQPLATSVLPSPTITAPQFVTSSLPRTASGRGHAAVLNIASSTTSPFYESGTLSASVSRDHSPQRYPRPPPSMIISPAHRRSLSADRTKPNVSALQRLVKRLSDVIDMDDDLSSSGGRRHDNNAAEQQQHATIGGNDVGTRDLVTSERGHVSRKAASNSEISTASTSTKSTAGAIAPTSSAGTSNKVSRWTATLALFRKKTGRTEHKQSSSSSAAAAAATTTTVAVVRPLHEQCASLSSGDVQSSVETSSSSSSSRQVHSHLSQSQPLHHSSAVSPSFPASSGLLATASSRTSKLARIIDPLKLRRRPNSSSTDLQTTVIGGGDVPSRRQQALVASRPVTRRARYSLTSAYMQGSL